MDLALPVHTKINTKAFCFCIYGAIPKYTLGLLENLKIVQTNYNDFDVIIYYSSDVPSSILLQYQLFPNTRLIENKNKEIPMMDRLFAFDDFKNIYDYVFVRDADSRITIRDMYTINQFIESKKCFHIVRDHFYHKRRIMGGACGIFLPKFKQSIQKLFETFLETKAKNNVYSLPVYGTDEEFLETILYPIIKDDCLIHTNIVGYKDESIENIEINQIDDYDFIGNVYEYFEDSDNKNKFNPTFTYKKYLTKNHIQWLVNQNQLKILSFLSKSFEIQSIPYEDQSFCIEYFYIANYYQNNILLCQKWLEQFRFHTINDHIIQNSNFLFEKLRQSGKSIIASFNPSRIPKLNEIIIYYGNYPHTVDYLPYSNKIYRHPIYFEQVKHDVIEYDKCFEPIDKIYILNLEERKDRYMELLVELTRIEAPLHKIFHYKAKKDSYTNNRQLDAYIGATKNHYDVVHDFITNKYNYCLILEDDFQFTSNLVKCKDQLNQLFELHKTIPTNFDFDIVFLSYSKYGKITESEYDILAHSEQPCTTSSGYILNKKNAHKIEECLKTGFEQMKEGKDPSIYCCDRYWAKLQKDKKFFVFRDKLGFQKITYSDIVNKINYNFD